MNFKSAGMRDADLEGKAVSHAQTSLTPCTDYTDKMEKPKTALRPGENERAGEGSVTMRDRARLQ